MLPPEIQRFVAHLQAERRASPHTVRAYLVDLEQYAAHLAAHGIPLAQATPVAVRSFLVRADDPSGLSHHWPFRAHRQRAYHSGVGEREVSTS